VVGALAVVNAAGAPIVPHRWSSLGSSSERQRAYRDREPGSPLNTTLCVVATNAVLDPAEAKRTASSAHAGLARALEPSHTIVDGDVVFCLATGSRQLAGSSEQDEPADPRMQLHILAAEAVRLAILDAVANAAAVETPGGALAKYPDLT
jgi:L-aminopeptidase/D-esterase-like protein